MQWTKGSGGAFLCGVSWDAADRCRNGEFLDEVYRSGAEPFMGDLPSHQGEGVRSLAS